MSVSWSLFSMSTNCDELVPLKYTLALMVQFPLPVNVVESKLLDRFFEVAAMNNEPVVSVWVFDHLVTLTLVAFTRVSSMTADMFLVPLFLTVAFTYCMPFFITT